MLSIKIIFLIFFNISISIATTEWFGDLRAYLNKPENPPYQDIIYDDNGNFIVKKNILFNNSYKINFKNYF